MEQTVNYTKELKQNRLKLLQFDNDEDNLKQQLKQIRVEKSELKNKRKEML